jgi:alpha-1,6-mannosyltransferase
MEGAPVETSRHPVTLHLTNAYHETSGGIRTFYHAALEAANREGRPFRLVVPAAHSSVEEVGAFGRIHRVAAPASPVFDSRYHLLLPHTYLLPFDTALRRLLAAESPALVEITDKYTLPWLAGSLRKGWIRRVRRPVLVGFSCERMDDNVAAYVSSSPLARRVARSYMRRCYLPMFDFHIAASEYIADELRAVAAPDRQDRIAVRTPGVDAGRFDPALRSDAMREELLGAATADGRARLLLYAGRLSKEKHAELLIDMMAALAAAGAHDETLVVVGSGPLEPRLRERAGAVAPGRVRFLPHVVDRQALARLYASSDVFVHPNPREPFGIGPLEAMASGCALVAPRAGGVLTYASDRNAWLAEPTGPAFAAAVRAATVAPDRLERLARARATARRFDWPLVMRRLFAHYDDLQVRARTAAAGRGDP